MTQRFLFTGCFAIGEYAAAAVSHAGGDGGNGTGGAILYPDGSAVGPSFTVEASSFASNSAGGGDGGAGPAGDDVFGLGGNGGAGGNAVGAALEVTFANSINSAVTLQADQFSSDSAQGGKEAAAGSAMRLFATEATTPAAPAAPAARPREAPLQSPSRAVPALRRSRSLNARSMRILRKRATAAPSAEGPSARVGRVRPLPVEGGTDREISLCCAGGG